MNIIIPTYGRADVQPTLRQLLAAGLHVTLVVQEREALSYERWKGSQTSIHVLPDSIRTIAPTRQHILHHVGTDLVFCMVDDDLWFYKRRDDDRTKLREITPEELKLGFQLLEESILSIGVGHSGFAAREGANRNTKSLVYNTRIMRVLAYDRQIVQSLTERFDDVEIMEDFHIALALLEAGYENVVMNDYAHNQAGGSAAEGGCSHFRTPELQTENAHKLQKLHPDYVRVVKKITKEAWGGGERTDVNISWKKAYEHSKPY